MLKPLARFFCHPLFLCSVSFLVCFCLGLLLSFPLAPYTRQLEQLARQQGLELQLAPPAITFPLGLKVDELAISHPQFPHPPLQFTDLALQPLWTTLTGDNPGVSFALKALQGQIEGSAFRSGKIELTLDGLTIAESLGPQLPLSLNGQLDKGEFNGTLPFEGKNQSRLQLDMSNLQLAGMQKIGASDDILPLGQLNCSMEATGKKLKITRLEIDGTALTLNGNGTLHLGRTPARSSVNLNLALTPQADLDPMLKDMLSLLQKPQADGSYQLRLLGTLENVRIK